MHIRRSSIPNAACLKPEVWDVLLYGQLSDSVDELDPDAGRAPRLEHVVHEILPIEVDHAAPAGVVLAEGALGVQAAQGPMGWGGREIS